MLPRTPHQWSHTTFPGCYTSSARSRTPGTPAGQRCCRRLAPRKLACAAGSGCTCRETVWTLKATGFANGAAPLHQHAGSSPPRTILPLPTDQVRRWHTQMQGTLLCLFEASKRTRPDWQGWGRVPRDAAYCMRTPDRWARSQADASAGGRPAAAAAKRPSKLSAVCSSVLSWQSRVPAVGWGRPVACQGP